jgi:hypothetical protein
VPTQHSPPIDTPTARCTAGVSMVLSLTCAVQNYDWGITGVSEVAALVGG